MLSSYGRVVRSNAVAFTIVELLVVGAIATLLLFLLLPGIKHNREAAQTSHRSGVLATLKRIETAKESCVADRHLKPGAPLTMDDLVRGGYLKASDIRNASPGIRFIVGAVGTPVTYTFDTDQR